MPVDFSRRARPLAGAAAGLLLVLAAGQAVGQPPTQNSPFYASRAAGGVQTSAAASSSTNSTAGVITGQDLKHDVSPALLSIVPGPLKPANRALPDRNDLDRPAGMSSRVMDPVVQNSFGAIGAASMPNPSRSFDGIYNYWGYYPPDTNGDVGPAHYVQIVNAGFQIFSKNGSSLYGPADTNTLWRGFGGVCETSNDGDPIALYDPMADRWMISQFGVPGGAAGFHQCIAVSTSADPTGAYYRYDFLISQTIFNDYPHFGVWPDGFYAGMNMYRNNTYLGSEPLVFDRVRMLAGQPATFQAFPPDHNNGTLMPADLDGTLPPPAGEPDIFATVDIKGQAEMRFFNFHVDWTNPANSTFTPAADVPVAPFNTPCLGYHNCINQPGTTQLLDALADRLMYRLAYRNFGDHQSLVTNHTVDVSNGGRVNTGVRWYEFRSGAGGPMVPSLYQQGTYAPDADNRWMGSVAMDRQGNIAVGYSVSGNSTYPSVRYTGRLASDPLGTLPQGERTLIEGNGSQTGPDGRWGDYSMMAVDPSDDCTFWYTQEYLSATADRAWRTRIGSFKFPGCVTVPTATPTGPRPTRTPTQPPTPRPSATATPCAGSATYTGSITTSDPLETGRLIRTGVASTCSTPKSCPGVNDSIPRHYDSYSYTNSSTSPQCVTVTIVENCGNDALLSTAYLGTFDPNNICANYLADMGVAGPVFSYSFTIPASSSATIVVEENSANIGCDTYTLTINPCAASGAN